MNGECASGQCMCNSPWSGLQCEVLVRRVANSQAGYQSPHNPNLGPRINVSSWGGSILQGEDGVYHMYAAEMVGNCGIDWWEPNSRIVHATSTNPEGPYVFSDVVLEPFAHEPNAVRAPNGHFVIYATVRHPNGQPTHNCTNADSSMDIKGPEPRGPEPRHTYMIHSQSPFGPWSDPVLVLKANTSIWDNRTVLIDTNLAVVILPDDSVVGIWRKCENPKTGPCRDQCCTFPHLLTATNWLDPSTYVPQSDVRLFPSLKAYGSEDPFLYIDEAGFIHAILHDEQGPHRSTAFGRHAFSSDRKGLIWHYGHEYAYNGTVYFKDNTTIEYYRRERPHFIINKKGQPTHLTNGVQESPASDRSYTLIQPLI